MLLDMLQLIDTGVHIMLPKGNSTSFFMGSDNEK